MNWKRITGFAILLTVASIVASAFLAGLSELDATDASLEKVMVFIYLPVLLLRFCIYALFAAIQVYRPFQHLLLSACISALMSYSLSTMFNFMLGLPTEHIPLEFIVRDLLVGISSIAVAVIVGPYLRRRMCA